MVAQKYFDLQLRPIALLRFPFVISKQSNKNYMEACKMILYSLRFYKKAQPQINFHFLCFSKMYIFKFVALSYHYRKLLQPLEVLRRSVILFVLPC